MFKGKAVFGGRKTNQHSLSCRSEGEKQGVVVDSQPSISSSREKCCALAVVSSPSYHYYQTNQVRTQQTTLNNQKYYNIQSWLDSVVKNATATTTTAATATEPVADLESNCPFEAEAAEKDILLIGEDYTCSFRPDQRYPTKMSCAKNKSPITDQKETLSRHEKIKTLKALITKHEKCTRRERLKRRKFEPTKDSNCGFKDIRKNKARLSQRKDDNPHKPAGSYSREQNIAAIGITARE